MINKINIPLFISASICLFLGLWIQLWYPNIEELIMSIVILLFGFILFIVTIFQMFKK